MWCEVCSLSCQPKGVGFYRKLSRPRRPRSSAAFSLKDTRGCKRRCDVCEGISSSIVDAFQVQSLRGIGEFGKMCLIPSGGILRKLQMSGSRRGHRCGRSGRWERTYRRQKTPANQEPQEEWARHGRVRARKLFERMKPRTPCRWQKRSAHSGIRKPLMILRLNNRSHLGFQAHRCASKSCVYLDRRLRRQ